MAESLPTAGIGSRPPLLDERAVRTDGASSAFVGGALGVLLALILAIAAVAAAVIGLLVALAALVTRFAPSRRRPGPAGPPLLEGRPTADGWVAERSSF